MESATATLDERGPEAGPVVGSREEAVAHPVSRIETWGIFLVFGIFYTFVGYKLISDLHVVRFDALDRLTRAFMVWYNDPPKLAAVGFSLPPISTFMLIPFAAVRSFVTSGLALSLSSGVFGALALTSVNRMFAMADMARGARLLVVLLVGLNPMFAFYSMNGTGDAAYLFFVAFALFCLIGWGRNGSARYLIGAGLAFALACLTKYEFIAWAFVVAILVAWTLNRLDRSKDEVEGSTIAYLVPIAYALGIWIFFNAIVLGDPFAWVSLSSSTTPVDAVSSAAPGFDILSALGEIFRTYLIFPAAIVAVPLLLFNFGGTRSTIGIGFALLILLNVLYSLIGAAIDGSVDTIELSDALPGMIAGIAGFAWLYWSAPNIRPMVWGGLVLLSVLAIPTAWSQMQSYPHQNLEQAFTRAISSGDDQEGTSSRGGYQVGISPESQIARFIQDQSIPKNEILTDNSRTYGVIALTGHPDLFYDRVDHGDQQWQRVLADPQGQVDFMLVENSTADLIVKQYPGLTQGNVSGFEPVVKNDRYTLLRVVAPTQSGGGATGNGTGTTNPNTIPNQSGNIGSAPPVNEPPPPGSGG